jgi:hypothetical protein
VTRTDRSKEQESLGRRQLAHSADDGVGLVLFGQVDQLRNVERNFLLAAHLQHAHQKPKLKVHLVFFLGRNRLTLALSAPLVRENECSRWRVAAFCVVRQSAAWQQLSHSNSSKCTDDVPLPLHCNTRSTANRSTCSSAKTQREKKLFFSIFSFFLSQESVC